MDACKSTRRRTFGMNAVAIVAALALAVGLCPTSAYAHASEAGAGNIIAAQAAAPISDVRITVTQPKVGEDSDDQETWAAVSAGSNYSVDGVLWVDPSSSYESVDHVVFEEGESYYLDVILKAAEGHAFATNPASTEDGEYDFGGTISLSAGTVHSCKVYNYFGSSNLDVIIAVTPEDAAEAPASGGSGGYEPGTDGDDEILKPIPVITSKKATVTVKASVLKKTAKAVSNLRVMCDKGKASYKNVSKNKKAKKFKVNPKSGKVTVPMGTKKGKYPVKEKVTVKEGAKYGAATKTVSFTIMVK